MFSQHLSWGDGLVPKYTPGYWQPPIWLTHGWCLLYPVHYDFDGLVQERRNSSALTMESHLSCINSSIWTLQQRADLIKILFYQYRKSYCGKRQFYNCPISSYTGNTSLKTVFILRHGTGLLWHDIAYSITRIRRRSNSECTRDNLIRP